MSAASALAHQAFVDRQQQLAAAVRAAADKIGAGQGYRPVYWTLVDLARRAAEANP
jgi:GH25 family lysozyme M1 (1,4-beta-N-acetylmuramidase)